jgi:hypothetical protein
MHNATVRSASSASSVIGNVAACAVFHERTLRCRKPGAVPEAACHNVTHMMERCLRHCCVGIYSKRTASDSASDHPGEAPIVRHPGVAPHCTLPLLERVCMWVRKRLQAYALVVFTSLVPLL